MSIRRFPKVNFPPLKEIPKRYPGWKGGLNTLVSSTKIKDNELTTAENVKLIEDGIISTRDGQSYLSNDSSLSSVCGVFQFRKSDGTKQFLVAGGTSLKKENTGTGNYDNIAGSPSYTANLDTAMIQAYDKVFISNGTDTLSSYDGTNFTTFTAVATPSTVSLAYTGAAGTTTYSYKVSAINAAGETLCSAAITRTLCAPTLSTSNFITVTLPALPAGATGFNIYGRKGGSETFLVRIDSTTTTWIDDGSVTASAVFFPPEENTTGGKTGKYMEFASSTLLISGDPNNPSRVYFSGGGSNNISNFSVGSGGGYIDISKSDGESIQGIKAFQDSVFVWKDNSVWKLTFTSASVPSLQLITRAVGCAAPRSIAVVENDIFFLSSKGVYVIGNEPNYVGVIRTNELSAKIRPTIQGVNTSRLSNVVGFYFNNKYILFESDGGSTYNNTAIVYDRERLSWYTWTNFNVRCATTYIDTTNQTWLVTGQDSGGRIVKQFSGSDDFGSAISIRLALKQDNLDEFEIMKEFKYLVFHFRDTLGTITITIIKDGSTVAKVYRITLANTAGISVRRWGTKMFGAGWTSGTTAAPDLIRRPNERFRARGLSVQIEKSDIGGFVFLDYGFNAKLYSRTFFPSNEKISGTST